MIGNNEQESTNRYIRCPDCGEQIMMVPVLADMIEAIEMHVATHEHTIPHSNEAGLPHPKAPVLREELTEQVLMSAADIPLTQNKNWLNSP